jgi:hypothetical protein
MFTFKHPLVLMLLFSFLIATGCQPDNKTPNHQNTDAENIKETVMESAPAADQAQLRHVVLFKFNDNADPAAIARVEEAFAALPSKIPQIRDFEWGLNNSPEGLDKGFTHGFLVTFGSEEDREIYLPHPDHQDFVKLLDGIMEDVLVFDYWTK